MNSNPKSATASTPLAALIAALAALIGSLAISHASAQETDLAPNLTQAPDSTLDFDPSFEGDSTQAPSSPWAYLLQGIANIDSNYIVMPAGVSPEMARVVEKLDSILLFGKGRLSVLHLGGSHVQADIYTDVLRQRLDSLNGGLRPPRGFIFPYRLAKTNTPRSYRISYGGKWDRARSPVRKDFTKAGEMAPQVGLSGISVWSSDADAWFAVDMNPNDTTRVDSISFRPTDTMRWTASTITLLCHSKRGSLKPVLRFGNKTLLPDAEVEDGYRFDVAAALGHDVGAFTVAMERDTTIRVSGRDALYIDGIVTDNSDDGIVYHSIGVNGASVPSFLRCQNFERQLKHIRPDLVILAIGINDASGPNFSASAFCQNYDRLIRSIRRAAPDCALLFVTNNDSKRRRSRYRRIINTNGPKAQQAFHELAERWQGGVWDLFQVMGGLGSMAQWQKRGLAQRDNIHFTRAGYIVVGNIFYDAFLNFYLEQDAYASDEQ